MNKNDKDLSAPMQLGWFVSKISKPFYNRQGFTKKFVIDNWKEIVGEEVEKVIDNILNEGTISDDMKESLDGVDPWMANKMKQ